jgi:membrane-associated phospholipid phosphatase
VAGTGVTVSAALILVGGWWQMAPPAHALAAVALAGVWLRLARPLSPARVLPLYALALLLYTVLRSYADATPLVARAGYAIAFDRALFAGQVPVVWLQGRLHDPAQLGLLDWLAAGLHWSYFVVPHAVALLVLLRRPACFPRYAATITGTCAVGLLLYFLVPTTPPWLAAEQGVLPGVVRILDLAGGHVDPRTYERLYDALGAPNPVAAMPSLHLGITVTVCLFLGSLGRRFRPLLVGYPLLMGAALIYLGEHYTLDLLAGAACAWLVHRLVQAPSVRRAFAGIGGRDL